MEKRAIFPSVMFMLAAVSFLFGGWQYLQTRSVQAASQKRTAFIIMSIEKSNLSTARKQELYATIMSGLPAAPAVFGIDVAGSFAGVSTGDSCTSVGQRTICGALKAEGADGVTMKAVCGACDPIQ